MPPTWTTIVGSAGATSVRLREATREPSISPANTARTARSTPFLAGALAARVATAVIAVEPPRIESAAARQAEVPLGDDVSKHLRGAGLDRVRARPQELIFPAVDLAHLATGPGDVDRRLGHPLVQLGPHQLENRALGSRNSISLHCGHCAVAVQLQRARLDRVLGDLLPHQRVRAAPKLAGVLSQLGGRDLRARGKRHAERSALVEERRHSDRPALA